MADSVPIRDAATVLLVRDEPAGMQVFMLRRSLKSVFVGGAYVFPGGAVDEADRHADLEAVCDGRSDADASALLEVDAGGLAYWVAAVRECFEEAGVLLAHAGDGHVISFADPAVAERFRLHRKAVDSGERRLIDVCRAEGLHIDAQRIHYFSHWITPRGAPRRYDTRFFVAAVPRGQSVGTLPGEADRATWASVASVLEAVKAGDAAMLPPTWITCRELLRADPATVVADSAGREIRPIEPKLVKVDGEWFLDNPIEEETHG